MTWNFRSLTYELVNGNVYNDNLYISLLLDNIS